MSTVTSRDGTAIAFERSGEGPPVILVDGALSSRSFGPSGPLAALLAPRFTVYAYDRRGRGESGDTPPYAVEREVEDLAALIAEAGGAASVSGISSGSALALEAAAHGLPIIKLAIYQPPFAAGDHQARQSRQFAARLGELLAAGRRGDAVELFLADLAGDAIAETRAGPTWPIFERLAPTLAYDAAVMRDGSGGAMPTERLAAVAVPTLVLDGGESPGSMRDTCRDVAAALPRGEHRTLPGQSYVVAPEALAPVLAKFFAD